MPTGVWVSRRTRVLACLEAAGIEGMTLPEYVLKTNDYNCNGVVFKNLASEGLVEKLPHRRCLPSTRTPAFIWRIMPCATTK